MKQLITCAIAGWLLFGVTANLQAQIILHIASGGQMYIGTKTPVSFDSLVVLPSSGGFLLGENDISKLATPNNAFPGIYLKRVYCFSHPLMDYNGSLGIFYNEAEANNINVNKLLVQVYSVSGWQPLDDKKVRNARHNVVSVLDVHHLSFSELLLGYRSCDSISIDPYAKNSLIALAPLGNADNKVTIYPNPATSVVNVQVTGTTPVKSLQLYDASGKLLMTKVGGSDNRYAFSVSQLASGLYHILIETSNGKELKSFVKQ